MLARGRGFAGPRGSCLKRQEPDGERFGDPQSGTARKDYELGMITLDRLLIGT